MSETPQTVSFVMRSCRTDWEWRCFARKLERERDAWRGRT